MYKYKDWKNTSGSFRIMIIIAIICVYILYFITFDFSKDYTLISWPIIISLGVIVFSYRMWKILKYRLQKKFINKSSSQITEIVSTSLKNLDLPFSIEYNSHIAHNPEIISSALFIVNTLGIRIGLVPVKKDIWVLVMYNKNTSDNDLIKICKEIDSNLKG